MCGVEPLIARVVLHSTCRTAPIAIVQIAIITGFNTGLHVPVAARRCGTIREAGVGLKVVGIVAIIDISVITVITE